MSTLRELHSHLSSSKLAPVYLLYGEEAFLQKEALKTLIEKVAIPDASKDFNQDSFYAKDIKLQTFLEVVSTLPVFCDRRLVICHDAHLLKEKDWDLIFPILQNPVDTTVIVFVASQWDKRKKYSKKLIDLAFCVESHTPKGEALLRWCKWLSNRHKVKISSSALDLLVQLSGSNLMAINNELQKVKLLVSSDKTIEDKDILGAVARVKHENVFAFTEAIGRQDLQQSFKHLVHLLEDGENEITLLSLISRHIRILSQIGEGVKDGLRPIDLSRQAGVPTYYLKDYMKQVSLWNEKKIKQVVEILHETDRALKSSPLSSDIWMENFVLKACSL